MVDATPLPQLNTSCYSWEQLVEPPSQWRRRPLSSEWSWISKPKECHELFIGASLTLEYPQLYSKLVLAAKEGWQRLCFKNPELLLSVANASDGPSMLYCAPRNKEEFLQRTGRAVFFDHEGAGFDLQKLRQLILQRREEGICTTEQAALLICANPLASNAIVGSLSLILNLDHQITDGIGARILLGNLLSLFAENLSSPPHLDSEAIDWNKSSRNLFPPWASILEKDQLIAGPEYDSLVEWSRHILLEKMPDNPGLPLLHPASPHSTQETHLITFSESHSIELLHAVKHILGSEATITHLGHAAMVLAMLRFHPLPQQSSSLSNSSRTLYSPCWLNGRRYLHGEAGESEPSKGYVPICQAFSPIVFSNLEDLTLYPNASRAEIKSIVLKACKTAMTQYIKLRHAKSVLSASVTLMESLGMEKPRNYREDPKEKNPEPSRASEIADPYFLSDGITEQYIQRSYFHSKSCPPSSSGMKVFEVDDVQFNAHAERNLIIRMSSWRGRITIAGEWRGCDYDRAMIVAYLGDVVYMISSILEE